MSATAKVVLIGCTMVVLIGCAASLSAPYFAGFCYSQQRYISDGEFIERALIYRAKYIDGLSENPPPEKIQAYLRDNPKCCNVEGREFLLNNTFLDKLFGFKSTWVRIMHPLSADKSSPNSGGYSDVYIGLDRCGQIFKRTGQHFADKPEGL